MERATKEEYIEDLIEELIKGTPYKAESGLIVDTRKGLKPASRNAIYNLLFLLKYKMGDREGR